MKSCAQKRSLPTQSNLPIYAVYTKINTTLFSVIPTLALSKSGYGSKVIPSSQPVTQAPLLSIFTCIVTHLSEKCKYCKRTKTARVGFHASISPKFACMPHFNPISCKNMLATGYGDNKAFPHTPVFVFLLYSEAMTGV